MNKPSFLRSSTVALLAGLLLSGVASAGLYVEQTVNSLGDGPAGMEMTVRAWSDGGKARVEYVSSNNPIMPVGSYLLTTDGGQTVVLVRPADKTYSTWDLAAVFRTLGELQEATGGMMKIDFKDPASEALSDEPGEEILGYSTRRKSWKSGYTMDMKMAFINQSNRAETVTDAWITQEIDASSLRVWFDAKPPTTGDPELDEVLTSAIEQFDGFPLKMTQQTTTTDKKGGQSTTTMVMEVTEVRQETPDAALFAMPGADYTETPLVPTLTASDGSEQESPMKSLKGMFGRKKKNKDD